MEIIKTQKGYLTILTGKTDMGKSTITVYDCAEEIKQGKQVIFFSYEYGQSIIYNKLISHFNVKWSDCFKVDVVDAAGLSLDTMIKIIEAKKDNLDAVYIDYLDLVRNATYASNDNEVKQVQDIVKDLAKLAEELNIAIVLLSQTGSSTDFEKTVEQLNLFTSKAKNSIKMFIGKGNVIDARINYDDIVHLILVDGYDLKHYSSINIKEIYSNE